MTTVIYNKVFEWDKNKNILNEKKHGINFEAASVIFEGHVIEMISKNTQAEVRILATGIYSKRYITVIYTQREGRKRIISARRAREYEEKTHKNTFG